MTNPVPQISREPLVLLALTAATLVIWGALTAAGAATDPTLLIDPGHSPGSPGTTSCTGVKEYLFNERLAHTVANYLREKGISAGLTREAGAELPLAERTARSGGNDLLLSLHHDSVQPQFIARQQNGGYCSGKARGFSIFVSARNRDYEASLAYARKLGTALLARGLWPSSHHGERIAGENRTPVDPERGIYRLDDLVVLKTARSPALLLEAAVIVDAGDEALASSPQYQRSIAEAVLETVR